MVINKGKIYIKGESLEPGIILLGYSNAEYVVAEIKPYIPMFDNRDRSYSIVLFDTADHGRIERVISNHQMYQVKGALDSIKGYV